MRSIGIYATTTTLGEPVRAFVPKPLPPARPVLAAAAYTDGVRRAELSLARLSSVSGLVPSVEWLLYSAIRKEALLTSQIEGTQATLTDLFDEQAGLAVTNTDDVEEVTNYLRAFKLVLPEPLMYLSGYLKQHQAAYYRHLSAVRTEGDWEGFVGFFLDGVEAAAAEAERSVVAVASLITADRRRLLAAPKAGAVSLRLIELLPLMPRFTIEQVRQKLGLRSSPSSPASTPAHERIRACCC